jgi:hypothetical protein
MKNTITVRKETQPARAERLKAAIVEILNCSPGQYNEFQYQSGLKYLKAYLPEDEHSAELLTRSKVFWNWWKNHWTNRDEMFLCLHQENPIRDRDVVLQLYTHYNSGKMLAECIHPNSVVLNETYAMMITQLVQTEVVKS